MVGTSPLACVLTCAGFLTQRTTKQPISVRGGEASCWCAHWCSLDSHLDQDKQNRHWLCWWDRENMVLYAPPLLPITFCGCPPFSRESLISLLYRHKGIMSSLKRKSLRIISGVFCQWALIHQGIVSIFCTNFWHFVMHTLFFSVLASSSLDSHIKLWDLEKSALAKIIDASPGTN